jgi:multiple sugar transport system permease protein
LLEVVQVFGLANSYLALIIPYTAINLPLTILVLRSFFEQLPKDLEDSAKIDGYNTVQIAMANCAAHDPARPGYYGDSGIYFCLE